MSNTAAVLPVVSSLDLSSAAVSHGRFTANSGSNVAILVMGVLLGLGCLAMSAWEWYDYFEQSDTRKALAFTKEPKMILNATVSERGAQYVGTCARGKQRLIPERWVPSDDFRKCSAGLDVDNLCRDKLIEYAPEPVENSSKQNRRLKHHKCANKYVPWLLVDFNLGGTKMRRCAYPFGTIANSKVGVIGIDLLKEFAVNKGQQIDVWTRYSTDHCVMGFDELEQFGAREVGAQESLPESASMMGLVGACILLYILSSYYCNQNTENAKASYRELERANNGR